MAHVLNWNGKDVPAELRKLSPGRYLVEEIDKAPKLTAEQERGLLAALASIESRRVVPAEEVHARLDAIIQAKARRKIKSRGRRR
jgi:hypothetical protein